MTPVTPVNPVTPATPVTPVTPAVATTGSAAALLSDVHTTTTVGTGVLAATGGALPQVLGWAAVLLFLVGGMLKLGRRTNGLAVRA